jgi:hypothetical protein
MDRLQRRFVLLMSAAMTLTVATAALAAPTPEQKCQKAKVLARAKWLGCRAGQRASGLIGHGGNPGLCDDKFAAKLVKAAAVVPCRFVDNFDGSVSDLDTGLIWEKKDAYDGLADLDNPHDADNRYSYGSEVATFIGQLNGRAHLAIVTELGFAGYRDWRIPNLDELRSILDTSVTYSGTACGSIPETPCIDPIFGPTVMCFNPPFGASCYYHSSTFDTAPGMGFAIDALSFQYGVATVTPGNSEAVRAVRNMAE